MNAPVNILPLRPQAMRYAACRLNVMAMLAERGNVPPGDDLREIARLLFAAARVVEGGGK